MRSYLTLAPRYLSAHKNRSRLAMMSVIISVALVVGIISLMDVLIAFEKQNVLNSEGNYHILVRNPSEREITLLHNRFDVLSSGLLKEYNNGTIGNDECAIGAIDSDFATNLNFKIKEGAYPQVGNELMLEEWYMDKAGLKLGDTIPVTDSEGSVKKYIISGIYKDWSETKATAIPIVFLSMSASSSMTPEKSSYFILFKRGINISRAEKDICSSLNISKDRIARNDALLAFMLQSRDNRVVEFYAIGAGLFLLILITAVVMIYNTFSISVLERIHHFGLLRCIGSSKVQIKRLIRREGLIITVKSIPIGLAFGILMSVSCFAVLRIFNADMYKTLTLFHLSPLGITSGILLGFLTVFLALLSPAKKAARISPVSALTDNSENISSKKKKFGLLSKLMPIDIVLGVQSATRSKKTLFLMSCSIALSIILFLLFQSLLNPDIMGVRPIQAYTADLRISSEGGISTDLYNKLQAMGGVKRVNGRMSSYVAASVRADSLTAFYKSKLKEKPKADKDGFLVNPEKSWLISYDKTQFQWAKAYLTTGSADEDYLTQNHGVILASKIYRDGILIKTTSLNIGDKVKLPTGNGIEEFTILGIADSIPYSTDETAMTTFITTEELFKEISKDTAYKTIDIQLNKSNPEGTSAQIKKLAGNSLKVGDRRQMNRRNNNVYLTFCVFVYGFVGVITLISILNIVNTMNSSVAAKMKRFGVMRAVGLSDSQLSKMIFAEAATFCLSGCLFGCIIGVALRKKFTAFLLVHWSFPVIPIILIVTICLLTSLLSVLRPLQQIKKQGISETINAM